MDSFEGGLGFHDNFYSMHTIKGWEVDVHPFWLQFDVSATLTQYSVSREQHAIECCVRATLAGSNSHSYFSWLKTQAKFSLHARETKSRIEGRHEKEQIQKLQEGLRDR